MSLIPLSATHTPYPAVDFSVHTTPKLISRTPLHTLRSEVVEGGSATLSFVQSCSTHLTMRRMRSDNLKMIICKLPISGQVQADTLGILRPA